MRVFEDSWKRIDRAVAHARVISKQWPTLLDVSKQPVIVPRGGINYAVQVSIKRDSENDLALELGEFFYQLRAALDAVAYKVVVLETGCDPPPKADTVEFPIYTNAQRFKDCPFMTQTKFPKALRDWLESIQSYNFTQSLDPDIQELGRRLKALHDCARKDRHRRLHYVVAGIAELKVSFSHSPNVTISNVQPIPIDFLGDEVDFLTFDAVISDANETNIRLVTAGRIELGMMEFPDLIGQELMDEFERIMLAARHVIEVFEAGYTA